jgi:NAD(P)-dependent dehydrogenase (short-subunit alcohol dehydrogenase family)
MELEGKRALVTGAGRGLGLAIATLLAKRGARVAMADLDAASAEQAVAGVGGEAVSLHCDVTKPADVQQAIADTLAAFGSLDVMVNNAGIEIGKRSPRPATRSLPR